MSMQRMRWSWPHPRPTPIRRSRPSLFHNSIATCESQPATSHRILGRQSPANNQPLSSRQQLALLQLLTGHPSIDWAIAHNRPRRPSHRPLVLLTRLQPDDSKLDAPRAVNQRRGDQVAADRSALSTLRTIAHRETERGRERQREEERGTADAGRESCEAATRPPSERHGNGTFEMPCLPRRLIDIRSTKFRDAPAPGCLCPQRRADVLLPVSGN
jgi:hypothetical protein